MTELSLRLEREAKTLRAMTTIYCRAHHDRRFGAPCPRCMLFLAYAGARLDKCAYGELKPACSECPIHCYKPEQREEARVIMRYAGPRMLWRHPWLTLLHFWDQYRSQIRIRKHRQEKQRGK